ncbi:MAG: ankyrin repeat domain-containing protein, partial [Rhodobacteraceae bacterium]|nr:ankyrin repeat domain-containing protein [Paracoccaceae bacterium]
RGADIGARDDKGRTPLHLAARRSQNPEIVDLLLGLGADAQAQDEVGRSPWDYAQENDVLANTNAYWRLNSGLNPTKNRKLT